MQIKTNKRSNNELAEEVIIPNLPRDLCNEFDLAYPTGDSMRRISRTLTLVANKSKKQFAATKKGKVGQGGRYKNNSNNTNKSFTNEFKIYGRHEWNDCR